MLTAVPKPAYTPAQKGSRMEEFEMLTTEKEEGAKTAVSPAHPGERTPPA